jgi:hypothetical protein
MAEARAEDNSAVRTSDVLIREVFDTSRLAVKYGTFAYLGYCAWQAVAVLAGKETSANVAVMVQTAIDIGREEWPPWALVTILSIWAFLERRFRRSKTVHLTARIAELEKRIDPQRESSTLLPTGETRKEDRP